jgi:hypothetical protein
VLPFRDLDYVIAFERSKLLQDRRLERWNAACRLAAFYTIDIHKYCMLAALQTGLSLIRWAPKFLQGLLRAGGLRATLMHAMGGD